MACRATCTDIIAVDAASNATTILQVCECMGCCQYMTMALPALIMLLTFLGCCGFLSDRARARVGLAMARESGPPAPPLYEASNAA